MWTFQGSVMNCKGDRLHCVSHAGLLQCKHGESTFLQFSLRPFSPLTFTRKPQGTNQTFIFAGTCHARHPAE